jgi:hypothetical protein
MQHETSSGRNGLKTHSNAPEIFDLAASQPLFFGIATLRTVSYTFFVLVVRAYHTTADFEAPCEREQLFGGFKIAFRRSGRKAASYLCLSVPEGCLMRLARLHR